MADRGEAGAKGADRALELKEDNERLIGGILLGNNLVNILATSLATALFTALLGEGGVAVATLVMTRWCWSSPRCCPRPTPSTTPNAPPPASPAPSGAVIAVLAPVVAAVSADRARRAAPLRREDRGRQPTCSRCSEEIMGALSIGHSEGVVEKEHRDRLLGALDLHERTVEEIMLHRSGIEMIDADLPAGEILRNASKLATRACRSSRRDGEHRRRVARQGPPARDAR
jgi:Mg2+/Co2+ transporter CorB